MIFTLLLPPSKGHGGTASLYSKAVCLFAGFFFGGGGLLENTSDNYQTYVRYLYPGPEFQAHAHTEIKIYCG